MKQFLPKFIISALSLGVATYVVDGIYVDTLMTLLIAAFLLGIVNAILRPLLIILTFPINDPHAGDFPGDTQWRDAGSGCGAVAGIQRPASTAWVPQSSDG